MTQTKKIIQRNLQHFSLGNLQTVGNREDILGVRARYLLCFETSIPPIDFCFCRLARWTCVIS